MLPGDLPQLTAHKGVQTGRPALIFVDAGIQAGDERGLEVSPSQQLVPQLDDKAVNLNLFVVDEAGHIKQTCFSDFDVLGDLL